MLSRIAYLMGLALMLISLQTISDAQIAESSPPSCPTGTVAVEYQPGKWICAQNVPKTEWPQSRVPHRKWEIRLCTPISSSGGGTVCIRIFLDCDDGGCHIGTDSPFFNITCNFVTVDGGQMLQCTWGRQNLEYYYRFQYDTEQICIANPVTEVIVCFKYSQLPGWREILPTIPGFNPPPPPCKEDSMDLCPGGSGSVVSSET